MGLLQRAEQLREEMAISQGHPLQSGGLRQRAELFRSQETGFRSVKNGSLPVPFPITGPGLLARAQRFRDQEMEEGFILQEITPEVKESLESAVSAAPGVPTSALSPEELMDWGEPSLPEEFSDDEFLTRGELPPQDELSDDEFLALGELPSVEEPSEDEFQLPEESPAAGEPESIEFLEPVEWQIEEGSDIVSDFAVDEASAEEGPGAFGEDEIFGTWGREAEEEASRLTGGEYEPERSEESPFLFDDDTAQTTPVETHIASQKKIDNYLSLFDITREIANLDNIENLWDTILYSVLGQLGPETMLIFASRDASIDVPFYPTAYSGFEIQDTWMLKPGEAIYEKLRRGEGARYAEEFTNNPLLGLSSLERNILEESRTSLLVPLKNGDKLYGIMMLGKQLDNEEYGLDDIEFVTRLGETVAFGVDRIMARTEYEHRTEELRLQNALHDRLFSLAHDISAAQSLDEIYDLLGKHLREDFDVESYSLALLDPGQKIYYLLAGNWISPASVSKFRLPVSSELVAMISNLIRVYGLSDFRRNREITSCYTNDDLMTMQQYLIIPLISLNWLVGFITVHQTAKPWNDFKREMISSAAEMISPAVANTVILGERESMFRDPFSPLETRLREELQKAEEFQQPLSLVEIRVKNIKRLITLNPPPQVTEFLADLGRAIAAHLNETDYQARISQGRFAVLLPGRSGAESEIFVKKIMAEFRKRRFLPSSPLEIQYTHRIVSSPADTSDPGKMLAMLE